MCGRLGTGVSGLYIHRFLMCASDCVPVGPYSGEIVVALLEGGGALVQALLQGRLVHVGWQGSLRSWGTVRCPVSTTGQAQPLRVQSSYPSVATHFRQVLWFGYGFRVFQGS